MRHLPWSVATLSLLFSGCACCTPCCPPCEAVRLPEPTPPTAVPEVPKAPRAYAFYDGKDGTPTSLDAFLAASKDADLVAFGEMHGHPIGADMELKMLRGMAAGTRPVALAMEFFERDVQVALDAYLAGTSTEAEFLKVARQGPAYPVTHRPLIEYAKEHHLAVIAANGPRRLVTDYRKSEKPYADYLAGLSAADRGFLPAETSLATGPYLEKFTKLMGGDRGAKLIKAQSLWDDSMADAIAMHRASHPDARVMLVVGGFHVSGHLGTITKFAMRRPNDRVVVLVMSQSEPPALAFDPDDKGEGDVILAVPPPPAPKPAPAVKAPTTDAPKPATPEAPKS